MRGGEGDHRFERIVDANVGVEIDDVRRAVVEEPAEQQRLDRRGELGDVVDAGQSPNLDRIETDVRETQPRDAVRARRKPLAARRRRAAP